MQISALDHFVLTVADVDVSVAFYARVLGMTPVRFSSGGVTRVALKFGAQKINLHQQGAEFVPHARQPVAGSGDFCLLTDSPLEAVMSHLEAEDVEVIEGPVAKTGATGPLRSVYFRDPDGNLVEVSNQQ